MNRWHSIFSVDAKRPRGLLLRASSQVLAEQLSAAPLILPAPQAPKLQCISIVRLGNLNQPSSDANQFCRTLSKLDEPG
jgi:hypothetical protein